VATKQNKPGIPEWMALSGLGLEMAVTVVALGGLGWVADYYLGWTPFGLITGIVLGTAVGMVNLIRNALKGTRPPKRT
jgi:F0F1-type ATP synthase assembly protein I